MWFINCFRNVPIGSWCAACVCWCHWTPLDSSPQMDSNAELLMISLLLVYTTVEKIVGSLVTWDTMMLMWRHCNVYGYQTLNKLENIKAPHYCPFINDNLPVIVGFSSQRGTFMSWRHGILTTWCVCVCVLVMRTRPLRFWGPSQ